jgi:hypothetical protein
MTLLAVRRLAASRLLAVRGLLLAVPVRVLALGVVVAAHLHRRQDVERAVRCLLRDRLVDRGLEARGVEHQVRLASAATCCGDSSRSCGSTPGAVRLLTVTSSPPTRCATYS